MILNKNLQPGDMIVKNVSNGDIAGLLVVAVRWETLSWDIGDRHSLIHITFMSLWGCSWTGIKCLVFNGNSGSEEYYLVRS